jgi:hypothetical protein
MALKTQACAKHTRFSSDDPDLALIQSTGRPQQTAESPRNRIAKAAKAKESGASGQVNQSGDMRKSGWVRLMSKAL